MRKKQTRSVSSLQGKSEKITFNDACKEPQEVGSLNS